MYFHKMRFQEIFKSVFTSDEDSSTTATTNAEDDSNNTNEIMSTTTNNHESKAAIKPEPLDLSTDLIPTSTKWSFNDFDDLPRLEESDFYGYKFQLDLGSISRSDSCYSREFNKLYVRMNRSVNLNVILNCKPSMPQLRLRAFLCHLHDVSQPVLRCPNHMHKETESNTIKAQSVLRLENPAAEYCGSAEGKTVHERYSVLLPLNAQVMSKSASSQTLRQTVLLKFACQNSCIGRRETCIVFLLENLHGEILAQRLLNVRICSCPKRDQGLDERQFLTKSLKRADSDQSFGELSSSFHETPTKLMRFNSCDMDSDTTSTRLPSYDIQRTDSGGVRIIMEVSDVDVALSTIEYAFSRECVNILSSKSRNGQKSSTNCYKNLKHLYGEHELP